MHTTRNTETFERPLRSMPLPGTHQFFVVAAVTNSDVNRSTVVALHVGYPSLDSHRSSEQCSRAGE